MKPDVNVKINTMEKTPQMILDWTNGRRRSHVEYRVNATRIRTEGMTMNGIGLNGRCRLNRSGVRGAMKECSDSALRPLIISFETLRNRGTYCLLRS
jgi:hypothetical protein